MANAAKSNTPNLSAWPMTNIRHSLRKLVRMELRGALTNRIVL